jgi:hypothetical protein
MPEGFAGIPFFPLLSLEKFDFLKCNLAKDENSRK